MDDMKQFEKVKALAKKKPGNDFLKSLLEQMAEGHPLSSKQESVLKEIEGEVKDMSKMKEEVAEMKAASERIATKFASNRGSESLWLSSAIGNLRQASHDCLTLAKMLQKKGYHTGELKSVSKMCLNLVQDLSKDSDIHRDVSSAAKTASNKTAAPSSSFEALSAYWLKEAKKLAKILPKGRIGVRLAGTYGVYVYDEAVAGNTFFNIFWRSGKIEVVGAVASHPGKYKKNFPLSTPTQDIFKSIDEYVKKWGRK